MGESENTDVATATLDDVVNLLERIAIALKTMVGQKQLTETNRGVVPREPTEWGTDRYYRCIEWARSNGAPGRRAIQSLTKAGIMSFEEITYERLICITGCGKKTIDEILEWAASKTGNKGTK